MYGLPQAGMIAQEILEKQLGEHGYHQSKIINSFWKHKTRPISFCVTIDDFAVKYVNQGDADHLIQMNSTLCVNLPLMENLQKRVFRLFRMQCYMKLCLVQLVQSRRHQDASAKRVSAPRIVVAQGRE